MPLRVGSRGVSALRVGNQEAGGLFVGAAPVVGFGGTLAELLFSDGEAGFLHLASDLERQLVRSPSGTFVASDGDPVGIAIDNHSWAGLTRDAVIDAQAEQLTNPSFASDLTGWSNLSNTTVTWDADDGGSVLVDVLGAGGGLINSAAVALTTGRLYKYKAKVKAGTYAGLLGLNVGGVNITTFTPTAEYVEYSGYVFAATANPSIRIPRASTNTGTFYVSELSLKLVPPNNGRQDTDASRPLWRANGGKPYWQLDGLDDYFSSGLVADSTEWTLACAFRHGAASTGAGIAVTSTGSNQRAALAIDGVNERLTGAWGNLGTASAISGGNGTLPLDQTVVGLLRGNASVIELWQDDELVYQGATIGSPSGATATFDIGRYAGGNFLSGRQHGLLARDRWSTDAEVARIIDNLQETYA